MDLVPIRSEVIEARRSRRAGAIVLARPVPMKVAGTTGAAVLAALALLLGLGEYTSKVRVSGQLVPVGGALKVVASQFGRITQRYVGEGDTVKAGQLLFEMTAERFSGGGSVDARIGAGLAERRRQIAQRGAEARNQLRQRAAATAQQIRLAETALADHRGALLVAEQQVGTARATYVRYQKLARQGFVAPALLAQYKGAVNTEQARRSAEAISLVAAEGGLVQLRTELADLATQQRISESETRQSLAALQQETAEHDGRSSISVTAPAAGRVTAFAYGVGQSVPAGASLATVLPAGARLEAQLLVPSRAKAAIERGQRVELRLDAFPYQKYGLVAGMVEQIELNPINDAPAAGSGAAAPMYRATVTLTADSMLVYGKRKPFEPGMSLEADIFNDRRRLIEWVLDPLVSAAKGRAP